MFNRFSSTKALNTLKSLAQRRPNNFISHPNPKEFIASTLADVPPTGRVLNLLKKKDTFGEQLFKKHQEKAKKLVLEFVHMIVHGSKSAYKDAKYLASVVSSKPKNSYTVEEIREVKRITRDLTKFVPFYASLIIPAGELALIPYLYLFPRAVPSYFMSEKAMKEEKYKYIDNQARGHEALREQLLSAMTNLGFNAEKADSLAMKEFFVQNHKALLETLDIHKMDSEMLKNASDFLMFEYVEGTYILNTLYKSLVNLPRHGINLAMWVARNSYRAIWEHPFFNYNFKMNSFPFEGLKKTFIKYQFEKQLKSMKAQNFAMLSNFYGNLGDNSIVDLAKERGHYSNKEEEAKKFLKDEWNHVSQANLHNEQYLFWYSVLLYECCC